MKKITLLFLFLIFCQGSMSQDLTKKIGESANKDLETLKTIVSVSADRFQQFYGFFYRKHKMYSIISNTDVRKKEIQRELEVELRSYFNEIEIRNVEKNKELFLKLVSE